MILETRKDLARLRAIGAIVADCLQTMVASLEVGMSTAELDAIGASYLRAHGAVSAPQKDYNFPGATCISLGEVAAHGVPRPELLIADHQLVNIDVSAVKDGLYADSGYTVALGDASVRYRGLLKATRQSLNSAADHARAGEKMRIIGRCIEKVAGSDFSVIRNLCSHGIGRRLHEDPQSIPCYDDPAEQRLLLENMVITIEPFLSTGTRFVSDGDDGWALCNVPGCVSAQYEHTMVIQKKRPPLIVTLPTR